MSPLTKPAVALASRPLQILVVDDYEDSAEVAGLHLAQRGHSVRIADGVWAALRAALELAPDVALIDLCLGLDSGYLLAQRLRGLPGFKACRFVAMTGLFEAIAPLKAAAGSDEFCRYLIKPIEPDVLVATVEGAFDADESGMNTRRHSGFMLQANFRVGGSSK